MGSYENQPPATSKRGDTQVEPPIDQWQALALLKAAGPMADQSGFKPASFDLGILGGAAAGAFTAQQILKDRQHRLPVPPNRAADKVTDQGVKIWKNPDGQPIFVELASGAGYKFQYKNHHMSQVTLPDGSYYSSNVKLKSISADDKNFDNSDDKPWTLHSQVNKNVIPKLEMMNVSVSDDGSVHLQHKNKAEEIYSSTGFEVDLNPEREIYRVCQNGGDQWTFDYTPDHSLSRITKQTPAEKEAQEKGEVYAPTAKMGLWSESTLPGGPTSGFLNIAARDPETGNVMLVTPERAIIFSKGGKSEKKLDRSKQAPQPALPES